MEKNKIEITVNGRNEEIAERANIDQLIDLFKHRDEHLIVEHNGQFVFPQKYATTLVASGDHLEFIHPDFGG